MDTPTGAARCLRTIAAGGFARALPLAPLAADAAPPETLYVKVVPDRCAAPGRPFSDFAALDARAELSFVRSVRLC